VTTVEYNNLTYDHPRQESGLSQMNTVLGSPFKNLFANEEAVDRRGSG